MGGRYGGDIGRGRRSSWKVGREVLVAIGRAARPDLARIGRKTREALRTGEEPRSFLKDDAS